MVGSWTEFFFMMHSIMDLIGWILVALFVIMWMVIIAIIYVPTWKKRLGCKHSSYFERMDCHAVCRHCHKDLGFIGTLEATRYPKPTIVSTDSRVNIREGVVKSNLKEPPKSPRPPQPRSQRG
jgi:hypothetical protein